MMIVLIHSICWEKVIIVLIVMILCNTCLTAFAFSDFWNYSMAKFSSSPSSSSPPPGSPLPLPGDGAFSRCSSPEKFEASGEETGEELEEAAVLGRKRVGRV